MKQENLSSLQKDLDLLIEKHSNLISHNEFNTALNVMKNIDYLTNQLNKSDYKTTVSKFAISDEDGKRRNMISIWEQNAFGDMKNIETYYLGKKYEENMGDVLDKLSKNWNTMSDELKDNIYQLFQVK